jgi:hypothetical protein
MCTLTAIPVEECVRLAFNRDELRSRPLALPPRTRPFGQRRAVLPLDPISAGTWIGVNDAGVALALLNVNQGKVKKTSGQSRGTIIPALLHCDSLSSTIAAAEVLDVSECGSFRLVIADQEMLAELHSEDGSIQLVGQNRMVQPCLFTSSGLGDHHVEGPRRKLFEEAFAQDGDLADLQDFFHRHRWPGRPHLSVCMSRPDAWTVSHTIIDLGRDTIALRYHPKPPDRPAGTTTVTLRRILGGVA